MFEISIAGLIIFVIVTIVGTFTYIMYLFSSPPKRKVVVNYREVNNPAVLRAVALTNTSHRNH